jgi:hypothetical protein
MEFIKPSEKVLKLISGINVDEFVERFNKAIEEGQFCLNSALDNIPLLTDVEFMEVIGRAARAGYTITRSIDNYQTVTYCMKYHNNTNYRK